MIYLRVLFYVQFILLMFILYRAFFSAKWHNGLLWQIILFLLPFSFGWSSVFLFCRLLNAAMFNLYHHYIYLAVIFSSLSLLPQWYKLLWILLKHFSARPLRESSKLIGAILFATVMITAIVCFFTLYYLWIDALSGYSQGLRSSITNHPILLDYQNAFYFSFVTYFSLGYGDLVPYGNWFHFMVFLECLISLLNAGIIIIYAYNLLFQDKR